MLRVAAPAGYLWPRLGAEGGGEVVQGVASGHLSGVNPFRWDELGDPVGGQLDLPVPTMDLGVMERAKEATVLVAAGPIVDPMPDVVHLV